MRLVTKEGVARLLAANPIAALAAEHGLELIPLGKSLLVGRCPLHEDSSGRSLLVAPESGRFRCLVCWTQGNTIGLLMRLDRITFMAALERLAARAGLDLDDLMHEPPTPRPPCRLRPSEVPLWALTPPLELR